MGRLNGLFTGLFFIGGSIGSLGAVVAWGSGNWPLVCGLGIGFGAAALLVSAPSGRPAGAVVRMLPAVALRTPRC